MKKYKDLKYLYVKRLIITVNQNNLNFLTNSKSHSFGNLCSCLRYFTPFFANALSLSHIILTEITNTNEVYQISSSFVNLRKSYGLDMSSGHR